MADQLPTPAELASVAEAELRLALDPSGTGAVNLRDGSRMTALVSVMTAMGARVLRYAADREAASRASSAAGDDLDVLARDVYGETRKVQAKATGGITLTRAASQPATYVPKGSRFAVQATVTTAAIEFEAIATTNVAVSATAVTLRLRAVNPGASGNITAAGAFINQIVDTLPFTGWAIGTPPADGTFGGGADQESDALLRQRLLAVGDVASRQGGTRGAILAGALRVVQFANVIELGDGSLALYAGDANYVLTQEMRDALRAELLKWRALGPPLDVRPYTMVDVQVTATLYMGRPLDEYDTAAIKSDAEARVLEYFAGRAYPDEYFREMILGAIAKAHAEVQHVTLAAPGTDALRQPDADYGAVPEMTRYRVVAGTPLFTILPPLTG